MGMPVFGQLRIGFYKLGKTVFDHPAVTAQRVGRKFIPSFEIAAVGHDPYFAFVEMLARVTQALARNIHRQRQPFIAAVGINDRNRNRKAPSQCVSVRHLSRRLRRTRGALPSPKSHVTDETAWIWLSEKTTFFHPGRRNVADTDRRLRFGNNDGRSHFVHPARYRNIRPHLITAVFAVGMTHPIFGTGGGKFTVTEIPADGTCFAGRTFDRKNDIFVLGRCFGSPGNGIGRIRTYLRPRLPGEDSLPVSLSEQAISEPSRNA